MIRTLIVDDDFRVRRLHADIVCATPGFAEPQLAGGVAAARRCPVGTVDLLLVDLYLPDGNGLELARTMGQDFMVLSAAGEPLTVADCLSHGALAYLIKPFDIATLRERLVAYQRYRTLLSRSGVLTQADVDQAVQVLHGPAIASHRPKGHSAPTEAAIVGAVQDAGRPVSAAEVAELVGISRATANRYLTHLSTLGRVEMQLRYGTAGRPEHLYLGVAQ